MGNQHFIVKKDHYLITTDPAWLDIGVIHDWLSHESYWANGRSLAAVENSLENSLCFGLYVVDNMGKTGENRGVTVEKPEQMVGFARVVTDYTTFGWLCDVFVLRPFRGQGLGKWLIEMIVAHPEIGQLKRFVLATRDAQGLYAHYGFTALDAPERWMMLRGSGV